eukprot:3357783-Rhodomonas_salina.1
MPESVCTGRVWVCSGLDAAGVAHDPWPRPRRCVCPPSPQARPLSPPCSERLSQLQLFCCVNESD